MPGAGSTDEDDNLDDTALLGVAILYDDGLPFLPPMTAAELGIAPIAQQLGEHEEKGETGLAFQALTDEELFPYAIPAPSTQTEDEGVINIPANLPAANSAIDTTGELQAFDFGDALPFESPAASPQTTSSSSQGTSSSQPPASRHPIASRPPAGASQPAPANLTLEQYASMCAELTAYPQQRMEVLTRYQLTSEAQLDWWKQRYDAHFRSYPSEADRFRHLMLSFMAYLQGRA